MTTLVEAKARLESSGLHVVANNERSLLIAGRFSGEGPDGIKFYHDACTLAQDREEWVVIFLKYQRTYEVPGSLDELTGLILAVYSDHRAAGGHFFEAFERVVGDPAPYLDRRHLAKT